MIFNITGGGGTELNFNVVNYNTEEELLLSSPAENTIGVITETPITSWIFDTKEPSVAESGMVWIFTDLNSSVEFNAISKNSIHVYPIYAKQYIDGSWLYKHTKIYQGREWADFIRYLYNLGDECTDITGGWGIVGNCTKSVTKNEDNIYATFRGISNTNTYGALHTVSKIDLTYVDAIIVNDDILESSHDGGCYFFVSTVLPRSYSTSYGDSGYINLRDTNTLDVSALDGSYYVCIGRGLNGLTSYYFNLSLKSCEIK